MAPDKIYLSKLVMAGVEILDKPVSDDDVEYIRKDALLEWAKELTSKPYDGTTESAHKHQIANYLRDKYNSL